MATIVPLFKTRRAHLNVATAGGLGMVTFFNQRFATTDERLQEYIQNSLLKDPALRIYVDKDEPTVDLETHMHTVKLPTSELARMAYQRKINGPVEDTGSDFLDSISANQPKANTDGSAPVAPPAFRPMSTADNALTGGANTTPRNAAAPNSTRQALAARLQGMHSNSSTPANAPTGGTGLEGGTVSEHQAAKDAESTAKE